MKPTFLQVIPLFALACAACALSEPLCQPGTLQPCQCPGGSSSTRTCGEDLLLGECLCARADSDGGGQAADGGTQDGGSACPPGSRNVGGRCVGDMVVIAGGTATGGNWSYDGGSVTVSSFQMDKNEVTVAQYAECLDAGACTSPGQCNWNSLGKELHPINCVDWNQASAFCTWAGKRLPTEIEWQWAASNGGTTTFPWGELAPSDSHAQWSGVSQKAGTAQVGTHPVGNTASGLQDMSGNVWEWTSNKPTTGTQTTAYVRGGSWTIVEAQYLKATYRGFNDPSASTDRYGFRCAK